MIKYVYIGKETVSSIETVLSKETGSSMEKVYDALCTAFSFPEYFGRNLDALYDVLTEGSEERVILLASKEELEETLGEKDAAKLQKVLEAASKEKSTLIIRRVKID